MNTLHKSIHDSILRAGEAVNPLYAVTYYLNPIDRVIEAVSFGGGHPAPAYHNIWTEVFTAPPGAIPESVVENLLAIEDRLVLDCEENFQGTEWNGYNHIGIWEDKPEYPMEYQFEIGVFWDPYDWFDLRDLKDKWQGGMTAAQIIDSEDLGNIYDGMCRRDEAIKWLEQVIEEWEETDFSQ
jgi:hypothetical protein